MVTGISIADLAVLGIASGGPIGANRIAAVAKALVPEHWQPTVSVITAGIERNLSAGLLRNRKDYLSDEQFTVTAEGNAKFRALLLCSPEALAPSAIPAAEAIQFCFLDYTDASTAKTVLLRFQENLRCRLTSCEQRSAKCRQRGRYKNFWLEMEQHRLKSMASFLATVSDETAGGDGSHTLDPV